VNNTKGGSNPAGYFGTGYGFAVNRQAQNAPMMPAANPVPQQYTSPATVSLKDQAPAQAVPSAPVQFPGGVEPSTPLPIGPGGSTGWMPANWWKRLGHPAVNGWLPIGVTGVIGWTGKGFSAYG
jgi:hypothetical protein